VRLNGQDITHFEPRRRDVAMVFQGYALYPHMTVAENIGYPLRVRRRPANVFVAGFVGSPSMNLLPGVMESGVFRRPGLCVEPTAEQLAAIGTRREITLGVRPEEIEFSAVSQPGWSASRVWVAEDLGNETRFA
jgi:ABC-type sugar transport system ATPase subunit